MIGNASIVALSEGTHGAAEPLEFRNRLFQHLVESKGFNAIAIESGMVESRTVHDYIRGGPGELESVLAQGIGWTMDQLPQNRQLVQWMRGYNESAPRARKLNFYGFDITGSPGNTAATRGLDTALSEALQYLDQVDFATGARLHARLDPFLPHVHLDFCRAADRAGYDQLSPSQRDHLTATINDLVSLFERGEARFQEATDSSRYAWAYRAAIGARQVDSWLRQVPLTWKPSVPPLQHPSEQTRFLSVATDVRDRIQADNIEWILQKEGPGAKVLLFAHRYHLSAAALRTNLFWPATAGFSEQHGAGTYLRKRFGEQLLTIGNLIGSGSVACADFRQTLSEAPPHSIDGLLGQLGMPSLLLDLREPPAQLRGWLHREHQVGHADSALILDLAQAFDVLFYLRTVRPATDCALASNPG